MDGHDYVAVKKADCVDYLAFKEPDCMDGNGYVVIEELTV
jgi:hypothetical protein